MDELDQNLFDEIVANALDILKLAAYERIQVWARIDAMSKELVKKLGEQDLTDLNKRSLNAVLAAAEEIIETHYKLIAGTTDLAGTAEVSSLLTARSIEIVLGLDASKYVSPTYLNSVASNVLIEGAPIADWWRGQKVDTAFKFASEVRKGLNNQETNQQIIARIVGKNGLPGVMDVTKRHAATLVQTGVQAVANDARRRTYDLNPDVIYGIRQVSTLDGHTSVTCIAYSGEAWEIITYKPIGKKGLAFNGGTPRHMNCRSIEAPITKTFKQMGLNIPEPKQTTRASVDGQVDASTTMAAFLQRKGEAWQNKQLGVGRAELWRAGKITLRDLVNGNGSPLTLEQLRRKAERRS